MLNIDSSFIVIFIMIWVLHFVLSRIFFNPVRKIIGERETKIHENKESCERALKENEQKINEIEETLRSARKAAHSTKDKFEREAFEEKDRLVEKIHLECRDQVDTTRKQFEAQLESIKKKLASEAENLAERIEQRILHS